MKLGQILNRGILRRAVGIPREKEAGTYVELENYNFHPEHLKILVPVVNYVTKTVDDRGRGIYIVKGEARFVPPEEDKELPYINHPLHIDSVCFVKTPFNSWLYHGIGFQNEEMFDTNEKIIQCLSSFRVVVDEELCEILETALNDWHRSDAVKG